MIFLVIIPLISVGLESFGRECCRCPQGLIAWREDAVILCRNFLKQKKVVRSGHKAEDRHLNIFATECIAVIIIYSILP